MKNKSLWGFLGKVFPFCVRDALVSLAILFSCGVVCSALKTNESGNSHLSMLFLLAVFLISLFTNGYLFGTLASFCSVLVVNYFFTYPFFNFNFTLEGYPLTIFCSLVISIITSTLVTKTKKSSELKILAEKEKTRSNLLRAVSHDLRTPLTTILGSTGAIIENHDILDKKQQLALLREIREDSEWLIRMVENLLTVTRIEEGSEAKIAKTPEPCEEIIFEAVRKFRKRFPDNKVTVKVPDEILMVPMDAMLVQQVMVNLLENVVLHAKGATEAVLSLEKSDKGAVFSVADDGCGIPPEIADRIFDIYRENKSETVYDSKKNMGIGLPVCKTIIKAHNGIMTAENRPEGGAKFTFILPMQ